MCTLWCIGALSPNSAIFSSTHGSSPRPWYRNKSESPILTNSGVPGSRSWTGVLSVLIISTFTVSPAIAETISAMWYVETITVPYFPSSDSSSSVPIQPAKEDITSTKPTKTALCHVLRMKVGGAINYLIQPNNYTFQNYYY